MLTPDGFCIPTVMHPGYHAPYPLPILEAVLPHAACGLSTLRRTGCCRLRDATRYDRVLRGEREWSETNRVGGLARRGRGRERSDAEMKERIPARVMGRGKDRHDTRGVWRGPVGRREAHTGLYADMETARAYVMY